MLRAKAWLFTGALGVACVVPDVEVADPSDGGAGSGASGGKSSAPSGGKGSVPPEPEPEPTAFGKFCNNAYYSGDPTTMSLTIGTGANAVTITADSDTCTPIGGVACQAIPGGTSVPVEVSDGTFIVVSDSIAIDEASYMLFVVSPSETIDGFDLLYGAVDQQTCKAAPDDSSSPAPAQ